jgi:hypothetical protein
MDQFEHDVFISHAGEDKAEFAEPLAMELRKMGVKVWFDSFSLKVGDSLRDSIERGLSNSRFGAVIFSPHFLSKNWPKAELNGLFTREMDGHKVILPIWHKISSAEMKAALPIQADKVALRSSAGFQAVARALVEVIRPELLEVETQRNRAFESAESLLDIAKKHHPGYAFTILSGTQCAPIAPGTIASVIRGTNRIDISISDPQSIRIEPTLNIRFTDEGGRKADELYRTGKAQSWESEEIIRISGTIPMMPSDDALTSATLMAAPNLGHLPPKYMRLEIGLSQPVTFPFMEMRLVRTGVEEAEAVIRQKDSPLEVSFIFSVDGTQRVETAFAWDFGGYSCTSCRKVIEAVDRLRNGDIIRLFDLETDRLATETPALADQFGDDPFPPQLRRIVFTAAEAEQRFGATVKFSANLSAEDTESLLYLDCLLNESEYGTNLLVPLTITKREGEIGQSESLLLAGEPMRLFLGATNFPGYFPLFGTQVPAPPWGLYTEQCVVEDPEAARLKFDHAAIGEQVSVTVIGKTPTSVRWKKDCDSMLGA